MHISICLLGVAGFSFESPPSVWETSEDEKREVLEDRLSLPPIWINSWEEAENVGKLIRPIIDALWNAVGEEQSPNYDISGNWTNDPKQKAKITLR